ncbi:lanthionine synthetase LanC family protein [Streptomyces sp. NPDC005799]|uniref:lanthionine synthetase LanC family protein n=1 Tax=Streptomyces sp. NPDC005799 TaxID=3154678 RepID=UPI0033E64464
MCPAGGRKTAPICDRRRDGPGGHGNFGLAHGITGPLALATALRHGHTAPGQTQAITRICDWLDRWRSGTDSRTWWPDLITRAEHRRGELQRPGPRRPSWCYGTPGIARAQQLAGLALGDSARQRQVEQALVGCLADDQ